jgi:hypothetical protein
MKILALLLVLVAAGLGYKYYSEKKPVPVKAPVEMTLEEKREALKTKIAELREELIEELKRFNDNIEYNGQPGYKVDLYGNKKSYSSIGSRTRHRWDWREPENADWITGPDFGLRRAQELRTEIKSTQSALAKLK